MEDCTCGIVCQTPIGSDGGLHDNVASNLNDEIVLLDKRPLLELP